MQAQHDSSLIPARKAASSVAPMLVLLSMFAGAGLYVNAQYPNLFKDLEYKILGAASQVSSANGISSADLQRMHKIDALIISPRNKTDLREGRPFWGAATHMVELAFGGVADDVTIHSNGARIYEFHRYGFGGNREPVVMEFANNILTCVHYPQRQQTSCSPGARSYYDGQSFPFDYQVRVTD